MKNESNKLRIHEPSASLHMASPRVSVSGATSGCGEAGPGCRVWLSHREGEAGRPQLRSRPEPRPPIHLRGPGLEGLLLVYGAWCWPSRGEWARGSRRGHWEQRMSCVFVSNVDLLFFL